MTRASRSPLAGLSALDRPTLYLLGLLSTLKAAALIGLATALSVGVVGVIAHSTDWTVVIGVGAASALLRAGTTWAHRVVSARALLGAKERLRSRLADTLVRRGSGGGSSAVLATQGLDELDKYYTVFLPALVNAATIPLLVGARILFADWISAVIVIVTVPLIPVFMALIGLHTRDRVAEATDALSRLSDHLVELARGLPVLIGLGRAEEQAKALRGISDSYRQKTMQTLRTAFLSALALELIATISVAIVAVFIGIRLISGELSLEVGLLVLLLAPECYTPLRDIGTAFHAAEQGREALVRVQGQLDRPQSASIFERPDADRVAVDDLTVRYAERSSDSVGGLSFSAPPRRLTVIDGRSGSGKSTVLGVLAGQVLGDDSTALSGRVSGIDPSRVAWLPQHPQVLGLGVLEELRVYAPGRPDDELLAVLDRVGLAAVGTASTATISPGELRRLAFARVLLRIDAGATLALLDEPTAQLDDESAAVLVDLIGSLRGRVTVIVASHDPAVRSLADHRVALDGLPAATRPSAEGGSGGSARTAVISAPTSVRDHPVASLVRFFRPQAPRVIGALVLGTLATVFAISLTGLSGWLIVRASQHPAIMYLLVAIVGVRFFGIGRAVLRYSERLASHSAVFGAVTGLRTRLWSAMSTAGLAGRVDLRGENTLDHLVGDVDRVRDLSIRVALPAITGTLSAIVVVIALGIVFPPLLPLFIALAVLTVVVAPTVALLADRSAARSQLDLRSSVLRRFVSLLQASGDLRGNGVDGGVRAELRTLDARAGRAARHGAWALGLGSAVVVAACGLTALLVLPLSAAAVASGALKPELVAVLALTPLGLIDPLLELVAAVQNAPALRRALAKLEPLLEPLRAPQSSAQRAAAPEPAIEVGTVTELDIDDLAVTWPGAHSPVFSGVSGSVSAGEWLVVTGQSGTGKSTLLGALLGQLSASAGSVRLDGSTSLALGRSEISRHVGWCPQEGHLFDSTLRANLLLARPRDDAPDEDEMVATLRLVGLGPLLERLSHGLDTRIGAGGDGLSGGERQRVAVARTLLSRREIVLLDEPTAHLDEESATRLMADLRVALHDRITVLVTHHAVDVRAEDHRIRLGSESSTLVYGLA